MAAQASWTWQLCDASGTPLGELATATGRSIAYKRNQFSEATCSLSHEDDMASILLAALAVSGPPTLRAIRFPAGSTTGVQRFGGYLAVSADELAEQATLSLTFRSPFGRLVGDGQGSGRYTAALAPFPATDQGAIAKSLIDTTNTDGATGLTTASSYAATKTRDRTYQYQNVGQAVMDLSALLDGFDFDETWDTATGIALFNMYAQQGSDRSSTVQFNYGPQTLSNVSQVSRTVSPPWNRITVLGANGLSSVYNGDGASQAQYGLWPVLQSATDVLEQATLDDKARALYRPRPVKTMSFTPELGAGEGEACPKPWDDWWIGDTVKFYGRRGAFSESVNVRINAATIAIDDNGMETSEVPDPTDPEADAVARALLQVEVTS